MPELKPLTDLDREFAAAMGETPEQMQAAILDVMNHKLKMGVKSSRDRHNRSVHDKLESKQPTRQIIEAFVEPEIVWIPEAYVIFIRHWSCTCGNQGTCHDYPGVFLAERPFRRTADETHAKRYTPVRNISHAHLPRRLESVIRSQFLCEECFEDLAGVTGLGSGPSVGAAMSIDILHDIMQEFENGSK